MKFRNSIEIKEPSDWELVASDVIDTFLEDFTKREGLTREPDDDDDLYDFDGNVGFIYTQKGMKLYYRMVDKLSKLGCKIFPNEIFSYSPTNINFP